MQLKTLLEAYEAPMADVVDIAAEQGFVLSDGAPGSYDDSNIEDDSDSWN